MLIQLTILTQMVGVTGKSQNILFLKFLHETEHLWHGKVPYIRLSCRGMLDFIEDYGLDVKTITFHIPFLLSEL